MAASGAVALLVLLPILSLALTALGGDGALWPHLLAYVLPAAIRDTVQLLIGVGLLAAVVGAGTAWLVTAYDFPGRRWLEWALLLPLAVPTYILAYAYLDILHPVGAVQDTLRSLLGYSSPRELRLPELRSLGGCILVLGFALYPYVYLTTRAMFLTQAANLIEASRTLGVGGGQVFRRLALPLARPAIVVGVSLALLEAMNDIGASEFLGVRTLTVSIYSTWINRSDLAGASQIALAMLVLVVGLLAAERWARRHQRYAAGAQRPRPMTPRRLGTRRGMLAFIFCALPVLIGFVAPASYLVSEALKRYRFAGISERILDHALTTVTLSAAATIVVLAAALAIAGAARLRPTRWQNFLARLAVLGYAVPGTVLALGLLGPVGLFDRSFADVMEGWFGVSTGLLLLGSGGALIYAYGARFLAIASGSIEAGFSRIAPSLDHAARTLGRKSGGVVRAVHLPLSKPALAAGGLLVFVDCAKELPATLLLRPLNVETLATYLYGEAARGTYEDAAIAALIIVLIGILPVILLSRVGRTVALPASVTEEAPGFAPPGQPAGR